MDYIRLESAQSQETSNNLQHRQSISPSGGIKITDGHNHILNSLAPDTWNNIPICLVKAVKLMIDSIVNSDQKIRQINVTYEQQRKKDQAYFQRIEKDFHKKEDNLQSSIDRTEKGLSQSFNKQFHELEQIMMNHRERVEQIFEQSTNMLEMVNLKLKSVDETEKVKSWLMMVIDEQLIGMKHEIKQNIQQQDEALQHFKNQFQIPNLIGTHNAKFEDIKEFLIENYYSNQKFQSNTQRKLEDIENTKIENLAEKLFKLNGMFDQLITENNEVIQDNMNKFQEEIQRIQLQSDETNNKQNMNKEEMFQQLGMQKEKLEVDMQMLQATLSSKDSIMKDINKELNITRAEQLDLKQGVENTNKDIHKFQGYFQKQIDLLTKHLQNKRGSVTGGVSNRSQNNKEDLDSQNLNKRISELEKLLDNAGLTQRSQMDNSSSVNQSFQNAKGTKRDMIQVSNLSGRAQNDIEKKFNLMDKQVKALIKKFEVLSKELRSNTAIVNKLKVNTMRQSNGSNADPVVDDRFGNIDHLESFRSNRNLQVNIERHMQKQNTSRLNSSASFHNQNQDDIGGISPRSTLSPELSKRKINGNLMDFDDGDRDQQSFTKTPQSPQSKFASKRSSLGENRHIQTQFEQNTENLIKLQHMINRKQREEEEVINQYNSLDKREPTEKAILKQLNIDKAKLSHVQKNMSLMDALSTKNENPLKLALEKMPNTTTVQSKQTIYNNKRQSADDTLNGSLYDNTSSQRHNMQQKFFNSGGDINNSLNQQNTGQRELRVAQTTVNSPNNSNIKKYVKGLSPKNAHNINRQQVLAQNSFTQQQQQLNNQSQIRPKSQVNQLNLSKIENQRQQMNQSVIQQINQNQIGQGFDQTFAQQSMSNAKPLYTIKEQSLEQLRHHNNSLDNGDIVLPQIDNSQKQPIPMDELSKIQMQISSSKKLQERRKLNSSNQLTQFSGINIMAQQQIFSSLMNNGESDNNNNISVLAMINSSNNGGATVGGSIRQQTAIGNDRIQNVMVPLEVKFENLQTTNQQKR
eukprot:403377123